MMTKYVAYYRVSTERQSKSGLGLAAQKETIERFVETQGEIIGEFVEIQSGRKDRREELWKAIALAKKERAKVVIARLDRFSRKVSFISGIMDQGISLVVAEMPNATDFQLHIFAALAQEERRLISERTKAALAEVKRRGVELGVNGRIQGALNRATMLKKVIEIRSILGADLDYLSHSEVSRRLNREGVKTVRGNRWTPQSIESLRRKIRSSTTVIGFA